MPYSVTHGSFSENSTSLSDLEDHFRRGLPPWWGSYECVCIGLPTSWWFPNYDSDTWSETRAEQQEREHHNQIAVRLCKSCPMRSMCLEWAIDNEEIGIWGGTFDGTRRKIRKARAKGDFSR